MSDSAIIAGFLAPEPPSSEDGRDPHEVAAAALQAAESAHRAWAAAPEDQREHLGRVYQDAHYAVQAAILGLSATIIQQLVEPPPW
ncbi:hypothetical protein [Peterkaempfera sp. SMS 1(5)a]|uniref:hypothetical protein n=1 Tax=Peterkaempfera podocarpi TaxID=3232308 RepID=UPI003672DEDA